ncbi:MAG: 1-acyl-sn-glycerol-3-phosphate acyltransferase [Firmicutes bacterium ADurb.Bin193]|nr:MAG: 1-acyl-sn-glycerol-3-phosphate acyltransferase [Firmicutes bacterium ADurb.Bin193]
MFFNVVYAFAAVVVRFLFRLIFLVCVTGKENIIKTGGFILSGNHKSNFDPVMLAAFLPRKIGFLAKRELFKNKIFGGLLSGLGAVPITRGGSDVGTLKAVISLIKSGKPIIVFPEGTRKHTDINEVKSGAVMFAVKGQVPIIPVLIVGEYKPFSRIRLIFGEPVYYSDYYGKKLSPDELHNLSVELMKKIYALSEDR